jgi:hypothetical protein
MTMALPSFAVTWDYRCPFARNAHEHLLLALEAGAGWDVTFVPFSLNQVHINEGDPDVWDNPAHGRSLLAMQVGIAVRDLAPDLFPKVHWALFAARHDEAKDIRERDVLRDVLVQQGADADAVFRAIDGGETMETFRKEHERSVTDHRVFGVPTFITGDRAAFIRVMTRPNGDADLAKRTIDRAVDAVASWSELNELKHTSIPR